MPFDVNGARQAGYSDDEILQHLAASGKFDVGGAQKAGYSPQEILDHFAAPSAPAEMQGPQPSVSQKAAAHLQDPENAAAHVQAMKSPDQLAWEARDPTFGQKITARQVLADTLRYGPPLAVGAATMGAGLLPAAAAALLAGSGGEAGAEAVEGRKLSPGEIIKQGAINAAFEGVPRSLAGGLAGTRKTLASAEDIIKRARAQGIEPPTYAEASEHPVQRAFQYQFGQASLGGKNTAKARADRVIESGTRAVDRELGRVYPENVDPTDLGDRLLSGGKSAESAVRNQAASAYDNIENAVERSGVKVARGPVAEAAQNIETRNLEEAAGAPRSTAMPKEEKNILSDAIGKPTGLSQQAQDELAAKVKEIGGRFNTTDPESAKTALDDLMAVVEEAKAASEAPLGDLSYGQARRFNTGLGDTLETGAPAAGRTATRLKPVLKQSMKDAAEQAGAGAEQSAADKFYREEVAPYDEQTLLRQATPGPGRAIPEVESLARGAIKTPSRMTQAEKIFRDAGDMEGGRMHKRAVLQDIIGSGEKETLDLPALADRVARNKTRLDKIESHGGQDAVAARNLREIADVTKVIKEAKPGTFDRHSIWDVRNAYKVMKAAMGFAAGGLKGVALENAVELGMARMIYSPAATQKFITAMKVLHLGKVGQAARIGYMGARTQNQTRDPYQPR